MSVSGFFIVGAFGTAKHRTIPPLQRCFTMQGERLSDEEVESRLTKMAGLLAQVLCTL